VVAPVVKEPAKPKVVETESEVEEQEVV